MRWGITLLKWLFACALYWLAYLEACIVWKLSPASLRDFYVIFSFGVFAAGCFYFSAVKDNARIRAMYVFGHEMTHYLTAKLFWKKTGAIRLGANGGAVEVQNPNVWITLSPYFFPFYVVLFLLLSAIIRQIWWPVSHTFHFIFVGVLAEAYAFHCVMTFFALRQAQSDITKYGRFFSYALIAFGNLLFLLLGLLITIVQWQQAWSLFLQLSCRHGRMVWHWIMLLWTKIF